MTGMLPSFGVRRNLNSRRATESGACCPVSADSALGLMASSDVR
jgi:hypothetical protein